MVLFFNERRAVVAICLIRERSANIPKSSSPSVRLVHWKHDSPLSGVTFSRMPLSETITGTADA